MTLNIFIYFSAIFFAFFISPHSCYLRTLLCMRLTRKCGTRFFYFNYFSIFALFLSLYWSVFLWSSSSYLLFIFIVIIRPNTIHLYNVCVIRVRSSYIRTHYYKLTQSHITHKHTQHTHHTHFNRFGSSLLT